MKLCLSLEDLAYPDENPQLQQEIYADLADFLGNIWHIVS